MKTIGITGGVGAGKTTVLDYLKNKYNAKILLADKIGHFLEEPGQPCYNKLVEHFGKRILSKDASIDSKLFAEIIFNDQNSLKIVNEIIHPEVKKYVLNEIEVSKKENIKYFVFEAALLIEEGYLDILDEIWYIHTEDLVRRQRLKLSRGYSDEKIDSIMSKQLSESEYRKVCKYTIDNSGTAKETIKRIDFILGENYE